jgi:hypothetical protein
LLSSAKGLLVHANMTAALLPPDKRGPFLQRVDAMLRYRRKGKRFNDDDVADCCGLARWGLMQSASTTAA